MRAWRWIAAGLVCCLFVAAFVGLGLWQLERLEEKRAFNATVERRIAVAPTPIEQLLPRSAVDAQAIRYRRALVLGRYDVAREVVISNQSRRGVAGNHVLTPLVTDDGRAVLVNRGWVPLQHNEPPVAEAAPPQGRVRLEGALLTTQVRGRFGPKLPPAGPLRQAFRIDIPRLAPQFPYELYPMWLLLRAQDPPQRANLPRPVALPRLEAGPHLSYAIQWFCFAAVAVAIYATLLVRSRRRSGSGVVTPGRAAVPS